MLSSNRSDCQPLEAHGTGALPLEVDGEARRSWLAPLVLLVYKLLGGSRRRRVANLLIEVCVRLEGGMYTTQTGRRMLADYGVKVGYGSYGECFRVGAFARGLTIGRYVSIAGDVRGFTQNHPLDSVSTHPFFYPHDSMERGQTVIESDAWIGWGAIITPGCRRIGIGAVVAAGSVVTRDVPDFAVVAGVPAQVKKFRFDEATQRAILESRWWEKPATALSVQAMAGQPREGAMPDGWDAVS